MLFSSIPFLYYFLPCVLLVYFAAPKKLKNSVLLLASLFFYGWGEPKYLLLMLFSIMQGYVFGLLIEKSRERRSGKVCLAAGVALSLAMLAYFKYADFMIANLNALTGLSVPFLKIALPIGISFYTFQIVSYLIDVYRGEVPAQRNFIDLAAYIAMFPQLIAGPIVRYSDIAAQIGSRTHTCAGAAYGVRRFVIGLSKKILIANLLGSLASAYKTTQDASVLFGWLYAAAFMLQIYYDFSGYSDMAIGLGSIFGFRFSENFNYPYIAGSITEFWRRWHISLSTWFRDYVYIPLGGNRVSRGKWVRNILVVWGLTGLWHGADWNFLLWGLYYGVLLLIEKLWLGKYLERLPKALRWLLCMIIVCIGWVMFNLTDFVQMRCALARMFSFTHVALSQSLAADVSIVPPLLWMLPALVFSTPVCRRVHLGESCGAEIVRNVVCLALLAVCIVFSVSATFNPFIYFRF